MLQRRALQPLTRSIRPASAAYKDVRWAPLTSIRKCSCSGPRPSPSPPHLNTTTKPPPTPPADHRTLGTEQELFTTSLYSPGSPLFLPNGARIFNKLLAFLRAQYTLFGFQEVLTPTIYKRSLWQKSGHWANYKDDMFEVHGRGATGTKADAEIGEDEEYGLKPMNCPGHCLLFKSQARSYKDLPIRYADFSPLHRNEVSGALSGLTRVRRFHQDDGHIFCRPGQIAEEISRTLQFVAMVYDTFKLGPYKLVMSTRPEHHYIGTIDEWDRAEAQLTHALDSTGQTWTLNPGDGAFYGPKIDIILTDSDGKEHQTATIQLDFQLPQLFELKYMASAPALEAKGTGILSSADDAAKARPGLVAPVIIHRAVFGSLERFMALLIEHHRGHWPFWLSPRQGIIVSVSSQVPDLADAVRNQAQALSGGLASRTIGNEDGDGAMIRPRPLDEPVFFVDHDVTRRSLAKKISDAKRLRYSLILVRGKRNLEEGTVDADVSGQPDAEATRRVLEEVLGTEVGDLRKVTLECGKVGELMRRLTRAYL